MREIPLRSKKYPGMVALVDDADYATVAGYAWRAQKGLHTFYARADVYVGYSNGRGIYRSVLMHRLVMPDAPMIDHVNGNGLDNCRSNLRPTTYQGNAANANKRIDGETSRYKGVTLLKRHLKKPWKAQLQAGGLHINIGCFLTEIDAALAYDRAAREYFGEYAKTNFELVA